MRKTITNFKINGDIKNKVNIFEQKIQQTEQKKEKEKAIEKKKQENRNSILKRMCEKNNREIPTNIHEKVEERIKNLEKPEKKRN